MEHILIIDDDIDMCQLLTRFLKRNGYEASFAVSGMKGLKLFNDEKFDLVFCDFRLGDNDGVAVLKTIKATHPHIPVIIITGYSDIKIAVDVIKHGAFDYITKPLLPDEVLALVKKALTTEELSQKNNSTITTSKKILAPLTNERPIYFIGKSPSIKLMYDEIKTIAPTNYSVIIYGESGTGKEVVAKTIHQYSERKRNSFIALDCGTLSKELASSELFGHVKGSFTGAITDKEGLFEAAEGGTLFLDEVANLPLDVQIALLRVIQERKYKKVGSTKEVMTDVRLIVASNEDLKQAYCDGKFREDLYHRFNEFSIRIPPLRQRTEDIIGYVQFFLNIANQELGKAIEGFEDEVIQLFKEYSWPGNLRECRNVVRRATLLTTKGLIGKNVLPWEIVAGAEKVPLVDTNPTSTAIVHKPSLQLKTAAVQAEYETIMRVLKEVKYNKTKAAAVLNIDRKTLYNKLKIFDQENIKNN